MQEYFDRKSRAPSPTSSKANVMWYSAPPTLECYDATVVNIFLNISKKYISKTFSIFAEIEITPQTTEHFCLAMAAVGGLFCLVNGSFRVAKVMFNDARKLLLTSVGPARPSSLTLPSDIWIMQRYRQKSVDRDEKLSEVLTAGHPSFPYGILSLSVVASSDFDSSQFILLELYGLCSGEKRSYEFVEAFHADLSQVSWLTHRHKLIVFDLSMGKRTRLYRSTMKLLHRALHYRQIELTAAGKLL